MHKKKIYTNVENYEEEEHELSELSRGSRSLFELCHDATNNLTPRGLTTAFNETKKIEGNSFEIFLWNGKSTTITTKVNCLTNCYELDKLLKIEKIENIMSMGAPVSIMSIFKNDVENASSLYSPSLFFKKKKINSFLGLYRDLCKNCILVDSLLQKKSSSGFFKKNFFLNFFLQEVGLISNLFEDFLNISKKKKNIISKLSKLEPDSPVNLKKKKLKKKKI